MDKIKLSFTAGETKAIKYLDAKCLQYICLEVLFLKVLNCFSLSWNPKVINSSSWDSLRTVFSLSWSWLGLGTLCFGLGLGLVLTVLVPSLGLGFILCVFYLGSSFCACVLGWLTSSLCLLPLLCWGLFLQYQPALLWSDILCRLGCKTFTQSVSHLDQCSDSPFWNRTFPTVNTSNSHNQKWKKSPTLRLKLTVTCSKLQHGACASSAVLICLIILQTMHTATQNISNSSHECKSWKITGLTLFYCVILPYNFIAWQNRHVVTWLCNYSCWRNFSLQVLVCIMNKSSPKEQCITAPHGICPLS